MNMQVLECLKETRAQAIKRDEEKSAKKKLESQAAKKKNNPKV